MATETLLFLGQVPYLFGVFLVIQIWYFVYNHFCPFLDRIPHLKHLNPRRACVKFGLHLVPLAEFLAWQGSRNCSRHGENLTEDPEDLELPDWSYYKELFISLYRVVPWRFTSRLWGQINDKNLPESLRQPLLGLYVWLFGCDITEALDENLRHYKNLQEFFKRELKPEVRPIDQQHVLVSPCDGKVLHYGQVKDCMLEQVKGVTYCLKTFLGPNNWYSGRTEGTEDETDQSFAVDKITDEEYLESLNIKEGNKLFHCIIYLAPGDYHRFHSPTDWSAAHRRHFPGELFSVNPGIAAWIKGLFTLNERVVITGRWEHGFFSMAAVGATNVGSISLYFDEELNTNVKGHFNGDFYDKSFQKVNPELPEKTRISLEKGSGIGEFNLGSTIVLIFEAPEDFTFNIEQGEKVKVGERLGSI